MVTLKSDFVRILDDSSQAYINLLTLFLDYSDPTSVININRTAHGIGVTIIPNSQDNRQSIIDNIVLLHRALKIKPDFSKSLKKQKNVYFSVHFTD